jgi:hypothetical protein
MIEMGAFAARGEHLGRISKTGNNGKPNYVVLEDEVHRVCAATGDKPHAIIFWTKDDESDTKPSADKIVSIFMISLIRRQTRSLQFGSIIYKSSKCFPAPDSAWEIEDAEHDALQYLTV